MSKHKQGDEILLKGKIDYITEDKKTILVDIQSSSINTIVRIKPEDILSNESITVEADQAFLDRFDVAMKALEEIKNPLSIKASIHELTAALNSARKNARDAVNEINQMIVAQTTTI